MEELLQLLREANEARRAGVSESAIAQRMQELTREMFNAPRNPATLQFLAHGRALGIPEDQLARQLTALANGEVASRRDLNAIVRPYQQAQDATRTAQETRQVYAQAQQESDRMPVMVPTIPGVSPGGSLPGAVRGLPEKFGHGASLGLSEEGAGILGALTGGGYNASRNDAMNRNAAYSEAHPYLGGMADIAGGAASIPLTAPLFRPASQFLERVLGVTQVAPGGTPGALNMFKTGLASGVPMGAVYGGADAPTLSDVPRSVALGGSTGGVVGGGAGVLTGMLASPTLAALQRFQNFRNPEQAAAGQVTRQMAKVINPDAAEAALSDAEHLRPGLARLGDANPIAYGAAMRRTPNAVPVEDAIRLRGEGAGARLAQDAEAAAGFRPGQAPNAILASEQGQRGFNAISEYFYKPIRRANKAIPLLERPKLLGAIQNPRVAEAIERVTGQPVDLNPMIPGMGGRRLSELSPASRASLGDRVPKPVVPFTALQEAENDLGRLAANLPPGSNYTAASVKEARDLLNGAMREEIPGFAKADNQWRVASEIYGPSAESGNSGLLGAFAQGARARSLRPEQVAQELQALSPEARSAYRVGLLSDITSDLRGSRAGVDPTRLATSQGNQSLEPHLREAFGSEQALRRFLRQNEVEQFFRRSEQAFAGGSATDPRSTVGRILFPNEEAKRGAFGRLFDQFKRDAVTIPDEQLAQGYDRAFNTQGPEMFNILDEIRGAQARANQYGPRVQEAARVAGAMSGGPARKPIAGAEFLALMALINGTKAVGRTLTGRTNDGGY